MNKFENISPEKVDRMLDERPLMMLDMRDAQSFNCGHLPGAILLTDDNIKIFLKSINKRLPVIIYCYHGISSQDMAQLFVDFGFQSDILQIQGLVGMAQVVHHMLDFSGHEIEGVGKTLQFVSGRNRDS